MTQHIPIPTYPQSPAALLIVLVDREIGRLLGPTVQQALADDKTGEAHLAFSTAMAALRAAKAWAESAEVAFVPLDGGGKIYHVKALSEVEERLCGERE